MEPIKPLFMLGSHFNVLDKDKFQAGLQMLRESLFDGGKTLFSADNMILWNRNLSFLRDPFFLEPLHDDSLSIEEKSSVWRRYILLYFAELATHLTGDFLELGCYQGRTALDVLRKLDLTALGKRYYLYDLFEWREGDGHSHLAAHDTPDMYAQVLKRFAPYPCVQVVKGRVPESFAQGFPDRIAFAHIDMNHWVPEAAALEAVLPRLEPRGAIVFDDYGWWGYSAQKASLDPIAARHGLKILELPTGQGLLIKP